MYNKLNITENHLRILSLFSKGYNEQFHIREINRILNISPRTSQLLLDNLEKKGILESKIRGKLKSFSLKKNSNVINYIILTEEYKKLCFLTNKKIINEIISELKQYIIGTGIIFGSYAKNLEKDDSDIDIFIIGKNNCKDVKRISKMFGIEINIKEYPIKTFEKNIRTDYLIKEIIKNHIIFQNSEYFVNSILKNE